ncbi:MAG: hypothetical protein GX567_19150, partial [Clostridia bacterium]|nr:hypothetical protein [Clostridia bacterium]
MKLRVMKGIIAFALCTSMVLSNINYIGASLSENATTDTNEITIDKNIDENTEGNTEENNGLITGGAAAVVDSSDTTTISENIVPLAPTITTSGNEIEEEEVITEDVVLETEVNGIKITLSGSSQAIPEGSKLQATELEPQTVETEIVEEALDQEEKEKKVKIQKYRAFDIKIMNGDSEIQPGENVKLAFSGDLLVPEGEEVIDVYHVNDADATVTSVKEEGGNDEVIAVTDSFSTYVLVIKTTIEGKTTVTSKYYLNHSNGSATQINRPTTTEIFLDEDDSGQFTITCDNGIDDVNGNQVYLLKEIVIKEDKVNGKTIKRIRNTEDNDIKVIEEKIDATNEKILVE